MGASARQRYDTGKACGEFIDVLGAGRTDAGVHARGMVANAVFDATDKERGGRERTPDEIRDYMNRYLPDDIAVKEVREASERFHARYKAVIPVMMDQLSLYFRENMWLY